MKNFNTILEDFWQYFKDEIEDGKRFHSFFHLYTMDVMKYNIVVGSDYFKIRIQNEPLVSFNDTKDHNFITCQDWTITFNTPYFLNKDEYFNYSLENECNLTWESIRIVDKIIDKIISLNIPFNGCTRS